MLRLEQVASLYTDPTVDSVKECAMLTKPFFTQVLGALYVQEYYDETATATVPVEEGVHGRIQKGWSRGAYSIIPTLKLIRVV